MRNWIISVGAVVGLGAGCLFPPEPAPDGSVCSDDGDCESGSCLGATFCAFSSCDHDADCDSAFSCDEPAQWQEWLSFGTAHGRCIPKCSLCPTDQERWSCSPGADERCFFDDRPVVDVGTSYEGVIGEPIALEAVADFAPGRALASVEWMLNGEIVGDALAIEVVIEDPGATSVDLLVTDTEGAAGASSASVRVCSPANGPCSRYNADSDCCGELVCDGLTNRCGPA